eukprot:11152895-Alexandrium_andersonii.AAC.1
MSWVQSQADRGLRSCRCAVVVSTRPCAIVVPLTATWLAPARLPTLTACRKAPIMLLSAFLPLRGDPRPHCSPCFACLLAASRGACR